MPILRRRLLLIVVAVVATASLAFAQTEKVYVTKTGAKYHRASCSSLSRSKIEMPLVEAARLYGPCKNCKPPVPLAPAATTTPTQAPASRTAAVESGRCQATTKKGTQCSRKAQPGRNYCWQH